MSRGSEEVDGDGGYLLVGGSVGHSLSPGIWDALFAEAGVARRLIGRDSVAEDLPAIFDAIRNRRIPGAWFTMPFKETAAQVADVREDSTDRSGAANLLLLEERGLVARNTDVLAVAHLIGERRFARAIILGSGGAARAAAAGLIGHCEHLAVSGMQSGQAEGLCRDLAPYFDSAETVGWDERAASAGTCQLIVNATPLGMDGAEQSTPLSARELSPANHVYDFVYRGDGELTPFGRAALAAGASLTDGLAHLVAQAVCALQYLGLPQRVAPVVADRVAAETGHVARHWSRS